MAGSVPWLTIIRHEEPLSTHEVVKEYLKLAVDYDNLSGNTKYCIALIMKGELETPTGKALLSANTMEEMW